MEHRSILPLDRPVDQRMGYSLLELLLVLVLIGMLSMLLVPSLGMPLARYRIDQAAGAWSSKLRDARLRAMETGRPHAVAYTPNTDRYSVLLMSASGDGSSNGSSDGRYQRQTFRLTGSRRGRELLFLPAATGGIQTQSNLVRIHAGANGLDQLERMVGDSDITIVFGGDGAAAQDRRIRIRDVESNRVAEISVQALTGAIAVSLAP